MSKSRRRVQVLNRADPELVICHSIDTSGSSSVHMQLLTNPDIVPRSVKCKQLKIQTRPGDTARVNFYVLRRVPSGYSPIALTIPASNSVGNLDLEDSPNVLGYLVIRDVTNATATVAAPEQHLLWRKKRTILYEGDSIILTAIGSTTSTSASMNAFGCFEVYLG